MFGAIGVAIFRAYRKHVTGKPEDQN
jgi:hypothetical protein